MASINTDLIVLHTTKFSENSLVIHTISEEYGRRSFLVRGVGKRVPLSFFLPMNILEADIVENPKSDLYTARNISVKHPLLQLRGNIYKNSMTLFLSEVLYRVLKSGTKEPGLFEWCEKMVLLLDSLEGDFSNFHIRFLLEFCTRLGFSPQKEDIEPFMGDLTPVMDEFIRQSFEESMLVKLNGNMRNEMAERLLKYIEFHCESAVNVNSLKVLKELFH